AGCLLLTPYAFCLCLLLLPGLNCGNLLCYYCPLQLANKPCKRAFTECAPREQCFIGNGHYGRYSSAFTKGCTSEDKCLGKERQVIQGSNITLSYACCTYDFCNSSQHCVCNHGLLAVFVIVVTLFCGWSN
uniref:UPAR/Ly6 domain-containing protein n=1 Tax=Electrophorus electricus TaxID=8005 RepID=A0A4W4FCQ8_ELEEL